MRTRRYSRGHGSVPTSPHVFLWIWRRLMTGGVGGSGWGRGVSGLSCSSYSPRDADPDKCQKMKQNETSIISILKGVLCPEPLISVSSSIGHFYKLNTDCYGTTTKDCWPHFVMNYLCKGVLCFPSFQPTVLLLGPRLFSIRQVHQYIKISKHSYNCRERHRFRLAGICFKNTICKYIP